MILSDLHRQRQEENMYLKAVLVPVCKKQGFSDHAKEVNRGICLSRHFAVQSNTDGFIVPFFHFYGLANNFSRYVY